MARCDHGHLVADYELTGFDRSAPIPSGSKSTRSEPSRTPSPHSPADTIVLGVPLTRVSTRGAGASLLELGFGDAVWSTSTYESLEPLTAVCGLRSLAFNPKRIEHSSARYRRWRARMASAKPSGSW